MGSSGKRIAIVMASFRVGGAERAMINLANGFQKNGMKVEMVVVEKEGDFFTLLNKDIPVHELDKKRARNSLFVFRRYLALELPDVLIVTQTHVQVMVLLTLLFKRWKGRLILNEQSTFTSNTTGRMLRLLASALFKRANAITVVSQGAAENFSANFPSLKEKISVIPNPVFSDDILKLKEEEVNHPFFHLKKIPIVLAAGRLSPEKNYKYLLLAFSYVLKKCEARLIILGEGSEKKELLDFAKKLGILPCISFHGNVNNPYAFMNRCNVFTLSSTYEGLPSVLIEALACGCNIVSTDCPHGPSEILNKGQLGVLVSQNNPEKYAEAIMSMFYAERNVDVKLKRARDFSVERITNMYCDLIHRLD